MSSSSSSTENPGDELDAPSSDDVRDAFAQAGLSVTVEERILALTASVDGGVLFGIIIGIPFGELAKLMTDDAYASVRRVLRRFHRRDATDYAVYVHNEDIDALIEPDLPPEAFLKLQGQLPMAPSGRIVYNRIERRWQDANKS